MKCQYCGAELAEGVSFCRDCGGKVEAPRKRFCRECGAELGEGAKFCGSCGASSEFMPNANSTTAGNPASSEKAADSKQLSWDFSKQVDDVQKNAGAAFAKAGQAVATAKGKSKIAIGIAAVLVLILIAGVFGLGSKSGSPNPAPSTPASSTPTNYTIEKGTQYAYMSDEANVFVATAVSDSIIKVERYGKSWLPQETMDYEAEIGAFKINDPENGFSWVDDEHTAFNLTFSDKSTSSVRGAQSHVFTINVNDSDRFKGTDYDKDIACYTYQSDDWHMYRAIPLTDSLVKIERWSRTNSLPITGYCFSGDWCIIDTNNTETDFEWTDDERTSFTITTQDPENKYYWKERKFVVFDLENKNPKYANVKSYLDAKK